MLTSSYTIAILGASAAFTGVAAAEKDAPFSLRTKNHGSRELSAPDSECATDVTCYLYDLEAETTMPLNSCGTTTYDPMSSCSGWSIKCNVEGGQTDYVKYSFDDKINTHYDAPWWMDGDNKQTRVNDAAYLSEECGEKHIDVTFYTWKGGDEYPCFTEGFDLIAKCGDEASPVVPPTPKSAPKPNTDLNIRFNKVKSLTTGEPIATLYKDDYPMSEDMATKLSMETNAVSIVTPTDFELHDRVVKEYVDAIGGPPTYPMSDSSDPFWEEFREVMDAQKFRMANGDPNKQMTLPELWSYMDIHEVAEAVHDEYPGHWQSLLLGTFFGKAKVDYKIFPFRGMVDFIGGPVRMAAINTWAMMNVAPVSFSAKWMYGRPRPEEIAYKIKTGVIPESAVPADIVKQLKEWDMEAGTEFTAYPEGSPPHPSWPAMHSAASSASFWMSIVFDLTEEQHCQALLTDYMVSYARTVAGVHYISDNMDGLNLGQAVLSEALVPYLVENYGADRDATQAKVDAARFMWQDFDPATCKISKMMN